MAFIAGLIIGICGTLMVVGILAAIWLQITEV